MSYDGRVYRILIASPSDVEEEREIAVRVIQEWNDLYSYPRQVVLLPLRWETHTAPEYGTRPQEVINRLLVDQCDLLVGIFWTRVGSPTGEAPSGTLEEIERVGKAGKPVMLYFSRVAIDPERIDHEQSEKLREFKTKTYPKGLVETYKSVLQFRDKFAKQLELRVRDLQASDASKESPLSLEFISADDGKLLGNTVSLVSEKPVISKLAEVPKGERAAVKDILSRRIRELTCVPLALAIRNASPSGIRNVYIELDIASSTPSTAITDSPVASTYRTSFLSHISFSTTFYEHTEAPVARRVASLSNLSADTLQNVEGGWRVALEWEAIQPQRTRMIRPVLIAYPSESTTISVTAKVYADSFPDPLLLDAAAVIEVRDKKMSLMEAMPEWKKLLKSEGETGFSVKL